MRRTTKLVIGVVAGLLCLAADAPRHQPVSWQDVSQGVITGQLGKPLGTVCEIKGVVDKIVQPTKADGDTDVELRITTLDGAALKKPIVVKTTDYVAGLKKLPKAGEEFSYTVYESGYFQGPLSDPRGLLPPRKSRQTNITSYSLCIRMNVMTPVEN